MDEERKLIQVIKSNGMIGIKSLLGYPMYKEIDFTKTLQNAIKRKIININKNGVIIYLLDVGNEVGNVPDGIYDLDKINNPHSKNETIKHENYRYNEYKWMKTMDGFGYPVDVYHGTVHLGILLANADGYSVAAVSGPTKQIQIKQGPKNMFKSKELAAQVLHHAWKNERHGHEQKED